MLAELDRLRAGDVVRVIDLLVVHKDADGAIRRLQHSDLTAEDAGAVIGALIGVGETGVETEGAHVPAEDEFWSLDDAIPNDSAAAIALVEHRWAIGTRDAIRVAGGIGVTDAWDHRQTSWPPASSTPRTRQCRTGDAIGVLSGPPRKAFPTRVSWRVGWRASARDMKVSSPRGGRRRRASVLMRNRWLCPCAMG